MKPSKICQWITGAGLRLRRFFLCSDDGLIVVDMLFLVGSCLSVALEGFSLWKLCEYIAHGSRRT